jgi:hypothetical protein
MCASAKEFVSWSLASASQEKTREQWRAYSVPHFEKYYHSLESVSTLTRWIIIFFKTEFVCKIWNYWILHDLLWYFHMSNEIIQSEACDNYDDFQRVKFIFSQKSISLFWVLFNHETDLRVRYCELWAHFVFWGGQLHETFPIWSVAGLNFELAIRGKTIMA